MPEATGKVKGGMTLLARYAKAAKEIKALEEKLKVAKEALGKLEPQVLEHMQHHGIQKTTVNGMTIYLARELWASVAKDGEGSNEAAMQALQTCEQTAFLVHDAVNTQTLSAWVRELPADESTGMPILPPPVADAIKVSEVFKVRARKG